MKWSLRLLPFAGLLLLFAGWLVTKDAVNAWLLMPSAAPPAATAPASIEPRLKELADGAGAIETKLDAALDKIAALERAIGALAKARPGEWDATVCRVKTATVGKRRGRRPAP